MNENDWYCNKIKGSFAESICRSHFESMNYDVEPFGIEHTSPIFASRVYSRDKIAKSFGSFDKEFRSMPDFLASRVDDEKKQAFLIEVKFRTDDLSSADIWCAQKTGQVGESRVDAYFQNCVENWISEGKITLEKSQNGTCQLKPKRGYWNTKTKLKGSFNEADLVELATHLFSKGRSFSAPYLTSLYLQYQRFKAYPLVIYIVANGQVYISISGFKGAKGCQQAWYKAENVTGETLCEFVGFEDNYQKIVLPTLSEISLKNKKQKEKL